MKTDPAGFGRIVVTVYCGRCSDERRRDPGRVGYVASGWAGLLWWCTHTRTRPRRMAEYQALSDVPPEALPDEIAAWCPHHGAGNVSTAGIIDATRAALTTSAADAVLPFLA